MPHRLKMDNHLRTVAYVDGYNLYYNALTRSAYKWLDLRALLQEVLVTSDPSGRGVLTGVKFFTAPIMGRYASDPSSAERQQRYHNALKFAPSGPTEVICGYHTTEIKRVRPLDEENREGALIRARVVEEKQTDVNIGLHMYRDIAKGHVDQVILVSNDSDLVPALAMIAEDFPEIPVGVVFPIIETEERRRAAAGRNKKLAEFSRWQRKHLTIAELEAAQLPRSVLNRKGKAIVRPDPW
ncbi:NYN domain-containing protein [Ectothiorhodospiraceae bacterium WFHF3C12]|nr:NYN domain-containing protein [Ectothiorhodospiraceae bacterium WFHF3C12]